MINNLDLKGAAVPAPIVAGVGGRPTGLHVDLAHHLPGRLRLRSAVLKGDARATEEAGRHLAEISGVRSASANPSTGSVLLEYDRDVMPPTKLIDALATHGYILRTNESETEARAGWADKLAGAMKDGVINALARRLALTVIGALV